MISLVLTTINVAAPTNLEIVNQFVQAEASTKELMALQITSLILPRLMHYATKRKLALSSTV